MADTVKDNDAKVMRLVLKKVEGISEPVKLVSAMGFAVGQSNKLYTWGAYYQMPLVEDQVRD